MLWLTETWRRLAFLARRRRFDADFEEQMRFHVEMEAEANREAGMDAAEARFAAVRKVGNSLSLRERSRDAWGWRPVEDFLRDIRYATRSLRRSPGFVAVALVSLALGIGVNVGVFEFADALFLSAFPGVSDSSRLVTIYHYTARSSYDSSAYADYVYYRAQTHAFASLAAYTAWGVVVRAGDTIDEVDGELVSPEYFATLGLRPTVGRLLTADDARPGADPAVVLGYRYWTDRFGGDPGAVGRTIRVGQANATIVGVAARGFEGLSAEDSPALWASVVHYGLMVPVLATLHDDASSPPDLLTTWGNHSFSIVGRLRPGWTIGDAERDLSAAARRIVLDHPERAAHQVGGQAPGVVLFHAAASRFWPGYQRDVVSLLWLLAGVAVLILLVACLNVASLVLARTTSRRQELAVRLSLGAGRGRLARQLLTENLLVTGLGAALGLVVAGWTVDLLSRTGVRLGSPSALAVDGTVDWQVAGVAACLAVVTAAALTLLPLRLLRSARLGALVSTVRTGRRTAAHHALVGLQIALSVVLVATAGLFVRTLQNARAENTTLDPERLLLGKVDLTAPAYAEAPTRVQLFRSLVDRARALPGVREASLVFIVPHSGRRGGTQIELEPGDDGQRRERQVGFNAVSTRYFETVGFPLVAGRGFSDHDVAGAPGVAIVNEVMAAKIFPGRSPIGHAFLLKWPPTALLEVVGVVRDGGKWKYRSEGEPIVYVPVAQRPMRQMTLEVRTTAAPALRRELAALGSDLTLTDVQTARAFFDAVLARERVVALLLSALAAIALLLAAIGVFGLQSYAVAQETREIGIRLAVGATPRAIVSAVLARSARLAGAGLAAGTVAALGLGRLVRGLLFGVGPADPLVFAATLIVLLGVALAASYLPARRAARIDPVVAIRTE